MCAALCNLPLAGVRVRDGSSGFHTDGAGQNGGFPVGSSRGRGGARQHECMKQITPEQVMRTIMRIPSFAKHMEERNGRKTEEGA